MRQRKRCVGCEVPHLMDNLGRVKPDDEVEDALCHEAVAAATHVIRRMSENERQLLLQQVNPPHPVTQMLELEVEQDEEGVATGKESSEKLAILSLLAIIILLIGAYIGSLF